MKIAVFASGSGTNFENLVKEGIAVTFVFSDKRGAKVLEHAKRLNVKSYSFELNEFDNKCFYEEAILELLIAHEIDLIILAGYMKIID